MRSNGLWRQVIEGGMWGKRSPESWGWPRIGMLDEAIENYTY